MAFKWLLILELINLAMQLHRQKSKSDAELENLIICMVYEKIETKENCFLQSNT